MSHNESPLGEAFYVDRSDRGRLRLTGRDRQAFLQGMVSNDVAGLRPGQGCYAFLLDPTGHVLADLRVLCRPEDLLLDVEPGRAPFVAETLDRYLIMEKCRIEDVTGETAQVFLGGAGVTEVLSKLGVLSGGDWEEGRNEAAIVAGAEATVAATRLIPGPGFDLYVPAGAGPDVIQAVRAAGTAEITAAALENLRIEAGVPRYGVDITEKVLAPETGQQARALSYKKGCYVGQEIVARIEARGHTNRTFVGLFLEGDALPSSGAEVLADGKPVGWLTSVTHSPTVGRPIALGYVRHEHAAPGTVVRLAAGGAARVAALPFVPAVAGA